MAAPGHLVNAGTVRRQAAALHAPLVDLATVDLGVLATVRDRMIARHGRERVDRAVTPRDFARYAWVLMRTPPGSLLDVGCSHGIYLDAAYEAGMRDLAGIDRRIGWLADLAELRRVWTPYVGEATALPFGDASWDTVSAMEILEHQVGGAMEAALAELRRVARHRLLITVPLCQARIPSGGHVQRFCADRLNALFPTALFTVLDKGPGAAYPWVLIDETVDVPRET